MGSGHAGGYTVAGFPDRFRRGETAYWLFGLTADREQAVYVGHDEDTVIEVYRFDDELVELAHERYEDVASPDVDGVLGDTEWASVTDLGRVYLETEGKTV